MNTQVLNSNYLDHRRLIRWLKVSKTDISIGHWRLGIGNSTFCKGFTLLELLIYSGMLMILLGVFATLFGMIVDAKLESDASSGVQQDGQYLLVKLSQDITSASVISNPPSLGSTSGTLQLTKDATVYTYSVDGAGNLTVSSASSTDALNSFQTIISNPEFRRIGNVGGKATIQYSFTVTSRTRKNSGYETETFTSTASLR